MKAEIKELARKNIEYMKSINHIEPEMTGQITLEMNVNKGCLCDLVLTKKERIA